MESFEKETYMFSQRIELSMIICIWRPKLLKPTDYEEKLRL